MHKTLGVAIIAGLCTPLFSTAVFAVPEDCSAVGNSRRAAYCWIVENNTTGSVQTACGASGVQTTTVGANLTSGTIECDNIHNAMKFTKLTPYVVSGDSNSSVGVTSYPVAHGIHACSGVQRVTVSDSESGGGSDDHTGLAVRG